MCLLLQETILYVAGYFRKRRKILKMQTENEFVWIRALVAILPAESVNCMQSSAGCNTAGRT
jgi:hypothetical protein